MAQIMDSHPVKRALFSACWCWAILLLTSRNVASQTSSHLEFPWMSQTVSGYYNEELELEPNTWLVQPTIGNPEVLCDGAWTVSYELHPAGGDLKAPSSWPQSSSSIRVKSKPSWVSWKANSVKAELSSGGASSALCKASAIKPTLVVACDGCIGLIAKVMFSRVSQTDSLSGGARTAVPIYVTEAASTEQQDAKTVLALFEKQPLTVTATSSPDSPLFNLTGRAQSQLKVAPSETDYLLTAVFSFVAREDALIRKFVVSSQSLGSRSIGTFSVNVDAAGHYATASIDTIYPSDQAQASIPKEYVIDVNCDGCATEGATLHFEPKSSSQSIPLAEKIQTMAAAVRESANSTLNITLITPLPNPGFSAKTFTHWQLTAFFKNPRILCDDQVQLAYTFDFNSESILMYMNWDLNGKRFTTQPNNWKHHQIVNWTPLVAPSDVEKYCGDSPVPAVLALNVLCDYCTAPTSRRLLVAPVNPIAKRKQPTKVEELLSVVLEPKSRKQLVQFATQVTDSSLLCSQQGFNAIYRFDESSEALTDVRLRARNNLHHDVGVMPIGTCVGSAPVTCAFKIFSIGANDSDCKQSHIDLYFSVYRAPSTKRLFEGNLYMSASLAANKQK